MNPDNHEYHDLLMKTQNLATSEEKAKFFDDLLKDFPFSTSIKLRRLQLVEGETFKAGFAEYIKPYYEKAQPSLFSEIKCLYGNKGKIPLMEQVFIETEQNSVNAQNPCCLLWSFMLLAQHFDYLQDYQKALEYIENVKISYIYIKINIIYIGY